MYQWGGGPQVNLFEQVSSDGHQMSLSGGSMSDVQGGDESVVFAVELVIQTKIWLHIHYIYLHTTNLYES